MADARVAFDLDVPIPTSDGRGSRARTPFTTAIQRLADDATPVGASFLWQDRVNTSAPTRYGLGWFKMRKVAEGDGGAVRGTRIWKTAKAPGFGNRVDGTVAPVRKRAA